MENCGDAGKQGRPVRVGARCQLCNNPTLVVCERCTGLTFNVANSPRPDQQPVPPKSGEEEKPQEAVANSGASLRSMLRQGSKVLSRVTRNVVSATDQLFGVGEEDIDRVVEEYKKSQLEERQKK